MKGITDIFRTYLNSGCKRIIIPCFGYDPDKFLDNICTHAYRDGKRIKTHKIIGFNVGTDKTEVLYEINIVEEKEKPNQKMSDNKICAFINYDKNKQDKIIDIVLLSREIMSEDWEVVEG